MAKFIKALPNLCAVAMCSYERGGGYVQILSYSKEEMEKRAKYDAFIQEWFLHCIFYLVIEQH